jgi:hypothetical protein
MCGLVEHRAQQGVATFGYPATMVDLAGLVALRRQADMRADRPGMDEALRLVDRRTVGQRNHRADARMRGNGRDAPIPAIRAARLSGCCAASDIAAKTLTPVPVSSSIGFENFLAGV